MSLSHIIYPEYFDITLSKKKGRKISKRLAFQNPNTEELTRIARSLGYKVTIEEKNYPGFWYKRNGRLVVDCKEERRKSEIIKEIAEKKKI